jgi:hypothetical protein
MASTRQSKTYNLQGETESRIEQEFENLYKTKLDEQLVKYFTAPNVSTIAKEKPILVKVAGNWYIYIRIEDTFYKMALTAV